MVADTTFFEAIPGLMERLSPALQKEVESFRYAPWKATTKQMKKALQKWPFEKVVLAVAPTIPHHCSDDFLIACRNLAREYDVGIHSHVAELKVQVVAGYKRYGTSLAAHMDGLGLVNEKFTVAHGVWLDDEDMKRLGGRGASVAHNPGSNMRLGNGLADARGMLNADVNVGIGTDGASCSDNQNMYEAMRLCLVCPRRSRDRTSSAGSPPTRRSAPPPKAAPARSAWKSRSAASRRGTRPTSSSSTCTTSTGSRPTTR